MVRSPLVAKQGALAALANSRPGRKAAERDYELQAARGRGRPPGRGFTERAVKLMLGQGKGVGAKVSPAGRSPV